MEYFERPTWDEFHMTAAKLISMRSRDPITKVGTVLIKDNKIISSGYNGMPKGIDITWNKNDGLDNKKYFVVHSEVNAILNATTAVAGSTAYVTLFPCNECAKLLIQAGITRIVYLSDKYHDKISTQAARLLFERAGIAVEEYKGRVFDIVEHIEEE